jgi:hypothetical protein
MTMIAHKLKHYNPQLFISEDERPVIKNLKLVRKSQRTFEESCVYFGKCQDFPRNLPKDNKINIISLGFDNYSLDEKDKQECNLIILDEDLDMIAVFNEIQDIFQFYHDWDNELQDALIKTKGLQHIIDISYKVFENPMYIIDSSFRTLAYTKEVSHDAVDGQWESIVVKGHSDITTVNAMKRHDILNWLNSCSEPILNTSPIFSQPRINANIIKGSDKIGTLIIIEAFNKMGKAHLHMAKHFVNVIFLALQKDSIYQNTRGEIYNYFFADLLEGKKLKKTLIEHQLQFLDWSINDHYFVLKVKVDKHDLLNKTLDYTAHQLENIYMESRAIIYHKDIILIINTRKSTQLSSDSLNQLENFLAKSKLYAGLSCCCGDISDIRDYYLQASTAVKLGEVFQGSKCILRYEDFVMYHLIDICSKTVDLYKLCHPAVLYLLTYDQENGSDYYNTLRVYINNDKNLVESAKALFIHRNTLVYRINKITELINTNLSNENVKTHILLSYKIIDYLKTEKQNFSFHKMQKTK